MLKQASISQIRSGEITKEKGHLVVAMCFYPRGLKKTLWDEYRADLAPDRNLFQEWKEIEKTEGHDTAFEKSNYEKRFELSRRALEHLEGLCKLSRSQDVYIACQCEIGQRCHREIILLIAEKAYGATIEAVHHSYPRFLERMDQILTATLRSRIP